VRKLTSCKGNVNLPKQKFKDTGRIISKKQEILKSVHNLSCFLLRHNDVVVNFYNVREDYHLIDGQGGAHGTTGSPAVRTHSPSARSNVMVVCKSLSLLLWWKIAVVVALVNDDLTCGGSLLRVDSGVLLCS
jgi:hypothetical protein